MTRLYLFAAHMALKASAILNVLSSRALSIGIAAHKAIDPEPDPHSRPGQLTDQSTIADIECIARACGASSLEFHTDRIVAVFDMKETRQPPFSCVIP